MCLHCEVRIVMCVVLGNPPSVTTTQRRPNMATKQTQVALHPDPVIAKALTEHARNGHKHKSAADLCRAVNITDPNKQRAVRQVLRDAGMGVGRGRRYDGITVPTVNKAAKATRQAAKKDAATTKAAKAPAKKAPAKKAPTAKAKQPVAAGPVEAPAAE